MNLLRTLATVSSMTLVSRILGFVRDMLVARVFGASVATDAFFVAFRIPNLLRRLFAEGAFSQAFVPILGEYKNRRTEAETRKLIDHIAGLMGIALFAITLIGIIAAPLVIYISAPGFSGSPQKFELTVELLRITFPYILFISLVSLAGGILNTARQIQRTCVNPGISEPLVHRLHAVAGAFVESASAGAGLGGVSRRCASVGLPGAFPDAHQVTAAAAAQIG